MASEKLRAGLIESERILYRNLKPAYKAAGVFLPNLVLLYKNRGSLYLSSGVSILFA